MREKVSGNYCRITSQHLDGVIQINSTVRGREASCTCQEHVLRTHHQFSTWYRNAQTRVSPRTGVSPWEISRQAQYENMAINFLQRCWCQKRQSKAVGAHQIEGEQRDGDQTSTGLVPHCLCQGQRTRSNSLVKLNQTAKQTLDCISENTTQADNCQQGLWWTHNLHSDDSMHAYISMFTHHVYMYAWKTMKHVGQAVC